MFYATEKNFQAKEITMRERKQAEEKIITERSMSQGWRMVHFGRTVLFLLDDISSYCEVVMRISLISALLELLYREGREQMPWSSL